MQGSEDARRGDRRDGGSPPLDLWMSLPVVIMYRVRLAGARVGCADRLLGLDGRN